MSVIRSYRDLRVWQLGMDLAADAYRVTKTWPKDEVYGLTSQIRRASSSIPANIAEGFGREASGSFVQFLRIAQGSLKEFETHLLLAVRVELTDGPTADDMLAKSDDLGWMIGGLIRKVATTPARKPLREKMLGDRTTTDKRRPTLNEASSL